MSINLRKQAKNITLFSNIYPIWLATISIIFFINLTKFITLGTIIVESIGAILLSFSFIPKFGIIKGIYFSIFHSISAFCNAGFDLMGTTNTPFSSLSDYSANLYVNIVLMSLIFLGGLGFFVWKDVLNKKTKIKSFNTQTKLVLLVSIYLVIYVQK